MKPDEQVVYAFVTEMIEHHAVSDSLFASGVEAFGERGVADLIAVTGYYMLVALTVNVDRTPIPNGGKPPMPTLGRLVVRPSQGGMQ
jgi:4-carboxymuconolactone decarboxylase